MFLVRGKEAEGRRSSSSVQKGVQLIKNRTEHKQPASVRTHGNQHSLSQHIIYKGSADGQVVIIDNKGATSANLL